MSYTPTKKGFSFTLLIFVIGIFLFTTACSGTKFYNRYNKDKACKMENKAIKKARKFK